MSMFFTIAVIVLVFLVIFQIAKAGEYVAVLKGEEKAFRQQNKINGFLMITSDTVEYSVSNDLVEFQNMNSSYKKLMLNMKH